MSNKTLNFTKLVIPVVLLLLICSCKPRVRSLAPENPLDIDPAQFDSCIVFSGWVITKDKEPIENAEVQVKKKRILTNKEGYFKIVIVKDSIDSLPRYVLNIRKKGYGLISDISFAGISNKLYTMKKATIANIDPANINTVVDNTVFSTFPNCSGTLRSLIDWDAYPDLRFPENVSGKVRLAMEASETRNSCNPGVTVVIPANAIADGNGNSPRDMVTVSLATVDIFDENSMPGDNTVMAEGRPMYMETYGAMNIDVYAGDTTFQLKKGEYAKIIIPVNPDQLKGKGILPARMPLLLYDEEKGVWKVEGNARLNNNGDAYIAKIDHFSSYNMDLYKEDPACIKLDANNIAGPFYVEVDYISATGDIVSRRKMFIENKSDDKIHALYNLPPNTDVGITIGRKYGEIYHPLYVMETNTGDPIPEEERPCPELPYNSCGDAVIVIGNPVLNIFSLAQVISPFFLSWRYVFPPLASNRTYRLQEEMVTDCSEPTEVFTEIPEGSGIDETEYVIGLTRAPGCYRYRIRGEWDGDTSPWSNTLSVQVIEPSDKQITIVNNIDRINYNSVLQLRIGEDPLHDPSTENLEPDDFCNILTGREIAPGQSITIPVSRSNYEVFMGLGVWEYNAPDCRENYKKKMLIDTPGYDIAYWYFHMTITGHHGGQATFTLTSSDTDIGDHCHIEFENGSTYDIHSWGSGEDPVIVH